MALVAATVLLAETVLFHAFLYVYDYYAATQVISLAVLGVGLASAVAGRLGGNDRLCFVICALGSALLLGGLLAALMWYPVLWLLGALTVGLFFTLVIYVVRAFARYPAGEVYLFDMAGAGAGMALAEAGYHWLSTEEILLAATGLWLAAAGLACWRARQAWERHVRASVVILLCGVAWLGWTQAQRDVLNLFRHLPRAADYLDPTKVFCRYEPDQLARTYDSLIGRIDVIRRESDHGVAHDGYPNDHFRPNESGFYRPFDIRGTGPVWDVRVLYGVVDRPRVFIIGSSAQGIVKTIKYITPTNRITAVEINPGVVRAMTEDFYEESGRAYAGLAPRVGNALAVLKETRARYDIITLINTHTSRSLSHPGPPDYLHTVESYELMLDRLSDRGYLLLEERVMTREGRLALYRQIRTLWEALRRAGAEDPSRHFVIWEWMGVGMKRFYPWHERLYVSMIVTREPIRGEFGRAVQRGLDRVLKRTSPTRVVYHKGREEQGEYAELFTMLERGSLWRWEGDGFDASPATNNRPFLAVSTRETPRLNRLLGVTALLAALVCGFFAWRLMRGERAGRTLPLGGFNVLIGFGYFFIQILLMLSLQNVFLGATRSVAWTIGLMLVSSGLGGRLWRRVGLGMLVGGIAVTGLLSWWMPNALLLTGQPRWVVNGVSVLLVALLGSFLGGFFPRGLERAAAAGMGSRIPDLFAINSAAGSLAVVLALWLGVKVGYLSTLLLALACYAAAAWLLPGRPRGGAVTS
ncbi:MAG: hypothetical protein D6766_10540 [Verrucomicrobia bacterium]|nr:MAG: hypothetical protein D6766_10540 [Verrucomicrobiota bacterium]